MMARMPSTPEELTQDERRQLRRAHERLRTATQEVQALVATDPIKNRWEPEPAPPEILGAARRELQTAWEELTRSYRELLGWEPPTT
jgi:hypothetical protein